MARPKTNPTAAERASELYASTKKTFDTLQAKLDKMRPEWEQLVSDHKDAAVELDWVSQHPLLSANQDVPDAVDEVEQEPDEDLGAPEPDEAPAATPAPKVTDSDAERKARVAKKRAERAAAKRAEAAPPPEPEPDPEPEGDDGADPFDDF